ncbi:MAG: HEAT repeat domain-containing protein [Promethearchaeota archaeon]
MSEESVLNDLKGLKSKDIDLKWTSINNLQKYLQANPNSADFRFRMIVKSLLPFTKAPEKNIREKALITLIEALPDVKTVESLVSSALSDPSPGIRSLALEWLAKQNHPQLKPQVMRSLNDQAEVVRKTAMELVVAHQIEGVEVKLLQLLKSETGGLRRSIIYALGKLKTPKAIGTLVEIMRNPGYDDWTRNQAGSALEHMGGRELILPFIENLVDPNDYVRETAAAFLKKNEQEITSEVISKGRIDLIASLQHGTDTTKQNFDSSVSSLTSQMAFAIKDLQTRLIAKDRLVLSELAAELQSNVVAIKVLVTKILNLKLIPLFDDTYLTETGLKRLLITELEENNSIHIPTIKQKDPFRQVSLEILKQLISTIPQSHQVNQDLYLTVECFNNISTEFKSSGILQIPSIATEINKSNDVVKKELIPILNPSKDGWYNSQNEYLTKEYLQTQLKHQIESNKIVSLKKFITQIGNPKIEISTLKEIVEDKFKGVWLEEINVFLEITEFQKLEQNSSGIDESRVIHLLKHINIEFPRFLQSLQKLMDIKTYQASDGQLITLENLHPQLQQHIIGKGYLSISEFLQKVKFGKIASTTKPVILDFITQEFSGRTTPDTDYFFTEDLIAKVEKEIQTQGRINFNVLGFKLDLNPKILYKIVENILFIRGFTNAVGEFVTSKGINQEIQGIIEYREEFSLQELLEILEIIKDKKNETIVREIISEDSNLIISLDKNKVMTQKKALSKVIDYVKQPEMQIRKLIPWEEISRETNISRNDIRIIFESLIQNNLLPGTLSEKGYLL